MTTDQDDRSARYRALNRKTKAELLRIAYAGGLIGGLHPPEKWTKEEIIHTVLDQHYAAERRRAATVPVPPAPEPITPGATPSVPEPITPGATPPVPEPWFAPPLPTRRSTREETGGDR